ncbi:MAG: hypothetical protein E5V89_04895 [Mesorhizobium sp.]|nr:MAG: hypothetical protein E5V89_04895 [Mesorhizobium sp.]
MTMISEPEIPAIELGEREKAPGRPNRAVTIGVVAAGAALVTFVNVTAAIYLYRGVNDLRALEARLDQLGQFEQRIGARIDTPPGANPSYQRIQQADGKVYYKKIN